MKRGATLLLASILVLSVLPAVQASAASSSAPQQGYVAYAVTAAYNGTQKSFAVNESVAPSSHAGQSVLELAVDAASGNFTYSHLVNSSLTLFPYMPSISNYSSTFHVKSGNLTVAVTQKGSSQVGFDGKVYTATDYAFTLSGVSKNSSGTAQGSLSAFPSGLVYSASVRSEKGATATATLTSTSLALSEGSPSISVQVVSAGLGVSVAAVAVALSLGVRQGQKRTKPEGPKPDHWVD